MTVLGEHKGDGIRYAMHLSAPKGGSAQMLRDPDGGWVSWEDYARLKADVERLRASSFVTAVPVEEYEKLKAEVERLRKAGDDLSASLTIHSNHPNCGARDEWLRAKKGLPSLAQQWEREKNNNDHAAKEGKPSV